MPKILDRPREGILGAAEQELTTKGVGGFNIRAVASLSGVAIGTIYNYYGNKYNLINSVLASLWSKALNKAVAVIQPGDPVGATLALYEAANHFFDEEKDAVEAIREAGYFFGDAQFANDNIRADIAKAIVPALADSVMRGADLVLAELVLFTAIEKKLTVEELKKAAAKIVS